MLEKLDRKLVKGFLKADGQKLVNGSGEEIILTGWGLGNWLLCEGYMWKAPNNQRFDRPRNIEEHIRDLAGTSASQEFWKKFRANYITRKDIAKMAELGYNSVRIPFNWRLFMEDEPDEIIFIKEGFTLLDACLDWCEEFGIYAFLDLHGAPGGQTGSNIDDSRDNFPRLFMDQDYWNKGIALWQELARRYKDRWIVGGYDLLNEPIRTVQHDYPNVDHYLPKLPQFYDETIAAIREIDKVHLLSIEGHHWSSDPLIFWKKYDDNMIIHFHRYGCPPDFGAFKPFTDLREKLNAPLWLGETGENNNMWYAALYTLAFKLDVGINVWPWKKMDCQNSPFSIKKPSGWDALLEFAQGGLKPSKKETVAILDEYLENMKIENCRENHDVNSALFRRPPVTIRGSDFDPLPGKGTSYSGTREEYSFHYQAGTGMAIRVEEGQDPSKLTGWACWGIYSVELCKGEFASYTIYNTNDKTKLSLNITVLENGNITVLQDDKTLDSTPVKDKLDFTLKAAKESKVTIRAESGRFVLNSLYFS